MSGRMKGENATVLRPHLKLVWSADGSDAPTVLEPGANPYLVAFHRGYMCAGADDVEQALGLFRETIALKPDFAEAHFCLGVMLAATGQYREAIAAYGEAIRLKTNFTEAYNNLGVMLHATGQFPEAIVVLREAVRLKPDLADAYHNLGSALEATGQFLPEAIAAYREAIRLKPDLVEAHNNLGTALTTTGRYREAIAAFREAIALTPDCLWPRPRVRRRDQRAEEAERITRDKAAAYNNLGNVLAATGQFPEAIVVLREARKVETDIAKRRDLTSLIKYSIKQVKEFGENNNPVYISDSPPSEAAVTPPLRMGGDDLNTKVKNAKAENLARAGARPATLQLATYRALLQTVDLLNPDLPEDERLRRANRLKKAYGRVRKRRPQFHDKHPQLRAAFNIVNAVQYQRTGKPKREAAKTLALG